jgi:branched-chain amino acid transport system ATP-binding protein
MSSEMDAPDERTAAPKRASHEPDDGVLVTQNLTKKFGGLTAVDDLSFAVQEQEILGFIGPNGAGKSTTFNCITGRYPPTEGTVYYRGEDVTGSTAYGMVQKGLARTFQEFRPFDDRTVLDNIQTALIPDELFSTSGLKGETRAEAIEVCQRVGLGDEMYRIPDELAHAGMLRLELGRAMATKPDVLLVDEPSAGLAPQLVTRTFDHVQRVRENGTAVLLVEQNVTEALRIADRGYVLDVGENRFEGPADELLGSDAIRDLYLGRD